MRKGGIVIRRYALGIVIYLLAIAFYLFIAGSNKVPAALQGTAADPRTFMTAKQLAQSETYSFLRSFLFFVSYPWEWGIYVVLLFGGSALRFQEWLRARVPQSLFRFPLYAAGISLLVFLVKMPLSVVGYALSRHYGITIQPLYGWLRDEGVGLCISTLMLIVAAGGAFWLMKRGGRWWLKLWLLSVPLTLFLMVVQPVLIDPLYDRFSRLSDPALESRILGLAAQAGVPADRVYEVHVAEKTNAINAYVNGIGPTLRIVLWDTGLKRLNDEEILQMMAHELGHYVMHHLEWSALGAIGSSLLFLWACGNLYGWALRRWGAYWGVQRAYDEAALPAALLLVSVLMFAALPFENAVAHHAEAAADRFAMELIGSGKSAVTLNQKLAAATLDDVNPPLLVQWFRSNHPSDMERIRDAANFKRTR